MKKILIIMIMAILAIPCFATDATSFYNTGTVTTGASTVITILKGTSRASSNSVLFLNDNATYEAFVDFTGILSEANMTAESRAMTVKAGENITLDWRTNKIKVRGNDGSVNYRFFATFE